MKHDLKTLDLSSIYKNAQSAKNEYQHNIASSLVLAAKRKLNKQIADYVSSTASEGSSDGYVEEFSETHSTTLITYDEAYAKSAPSDLIKSQLNTDAVTSWLKLNSINKLSGKWLMPQLVSMFGQLKLPDVGEDGLYCVKKLLNLNFSPELFGAIQLAKYTNRSEFLDSQTTYPNSGYCKLVPLVLLGLRLHKDIPYSKWSPEYLELIVNKDLYLFMTSAAIEATPFDLLVVRQDARLVKSGKSAGTARNISAMYTINGSYDVFPEGTPNLAKVAALQVWCAAPEYRNSNMVLDPVNWDKMPGPLLSTTVLVNDTLDLSW